MISMLPADWFFSLILIFQSQMSWATNVKQLLFFLAVSFSNCPFFVVGSILIALRQQRLSPAQVLQFLAADDLTPKERQK